MRGGKQHRGLAGFSYTRYRGDGVGRLSGHIAPSWERTAPPAQTRSCRTLLPRPGAGGWARHKAGPAGGARGSGEGGVGLID